MEIAQIILEYIKVLVWPILFIVFIIIFRKQLDEMIKHRLKKIALPGGFSLDFSEEVNQAKTLSLEVEKETKDKISTSTFESSSMLPITEANMRLLKLGLQPSPSGLDITYYKNLASQDPNKALAGMGMEIDILAKNLAKGFNVQIDRDDSGEKLVQRLYDAKAITKNQYDLATKLIYICNAAIHGQKITTIEAETVIEIAKTLTDMYIRWLGWGFKDGWKPKK